MTPLPIAISVPAIHIGAQLRIPAVATPPRIDGDLADAAWSSALKSDSFVRFGGEGGVRENTTAWLAADSRHLYIAVRCDDRQAGRIRASETQRGGNLTDDDHVMVRVDSQNTHRAFSSFSVNAAGTQSETIEGGTGGNWRWSGNWLARVRVDENGWSAEIQIPWTMLRYPVGARSISLAISRRIARETNPTIWPAIPVEGQTDATLARFLPVFETPPLPARRPLPVVLPFVLNTVERGASSRQGVDVKLPIDTTLTGLLTVRPDFQTVENDVARINFSYNELLVRDQRPFFAEGAEFLPESDLLYTRRITDVDEGVKLVGRSGNRTVGFVGTNHHTGDRDRAVAGLRLEQALSPLSKVGFSAVADDRQAAARNQTARAYGEWGTPIGKQTLSLATQQSFSWNAGKATGGGSETAVTLRNVPGKPYFRWKSTSLDADFTSNLGLLVDRDRRSQEFKVGQAFRFDKGPVEIYNVEATRSFADRQDGSFFYDGWLFTGYVQNRRGYALNLGKWLQDRRQTVGGPTFDDRIDHVAVMWNRRNLFNPGGLAFDTGRQQGQTYRFVEVEQGVLVSRPLSFRFSHSMQWRGGVQIRQTIATGTWRIDEGRAISARLVSQNGTGNAGNVGPQSGTNLYVAYGQRTRGGTDLFVVLGDPNSADTRSRLIVKVTRPY